MVTLPFALSDVLAQFLAFLPRLLTALMIFIVALYLSGWVSKGVRRALKLRKTSHRADDLIVKIIQVSLNSLGLLLALQHVGFNVSAFLAGLGIMGFTIGFALQDVSKNFVAGLLLYIQQPFAVGDVIAVAEYTGKVEAIDLRATEIRTLEGTQVLIPNADVISKAITNFSAYPTRRLSVTSAVAHTADLEAARQAVLAAITSLPGVLAEPAPEVVFNTLHAAAIGFTLNFWVDLNQVGYGQAQDAAILHIKAAFEQAGIEVSAPTSTIKILPHS